MACISAAVTRYIFLSSLFDPAAGSKYPGPKGQALGYPWKGLISCKLDKFEVTKVS